MSEFVNGCHVVTLSRCHRGCIVVTMSLLRRIVILVNLGILWSAWRAGNTRHVRALPSPTTASLPARVGHTNTQKHAQRGCVQMCAMCVMCGGKTHVVWGGKGRVRRIRSLGRLKSARERKKKRKKKNTFGSERKCFKRRARKRETTASTARVRRGIRATWGTPS